MYSITYRDVADSWQYRCIDIKAVFEQSYPDDTNYRVEEIEVYRHAYNDIWVDEVVVAGRATTENTDGMSRGVWGWRYLCFK